MTTVFDLMTRDPVTLRPDHPVAQALSEMCAGGFRHLPVVDAEQRMVGLISDRDLRSVTDRRQPVGEVMQTDVLAVGPRTAAAQAAYLMLRDAIGCVPVTDPDGHLLGIVTETDFVRLAFDLLSPPGASFDALVEEDRGDPP
jgi:CBS domain-containing membrane protein